MLIKGIIDEDFVNYKKPAMYIAFPTCTFKCDEYCDVSICQNSPLANEPDLDIPTEKIIERYIFNPITEAVVLSGLEPFDSPEQLKQFVSLFREKYHCNDDIVIYTGYTESEILSGWREEYDFLHKYPNIIVKFGRFIYNGMPRFDEVLGVLLASSNQYAKEIGSNDQT